MNVAGGREALHDAQQQQQQRRTHAEDGVAGQAPDEERRPAHHEDGDGQGPLAALLVAHVPPEDSADGAHEEREREHGERAHYRHEAIFAREEDERDDRGQIGITRVVEPFDEIAKERRERDLFQGFMLLFFRKRPGRSGVGSRAFNIHDSPLRNARLCGAGDKTAWQAFASCGALLTKMGRYASSNRYDNAKTRLTTKM